MASLKSFVLKQFFKLWNCQKSEKIFLKISEIREISNFYNEFIELSFFDASNRSTAELPTPPTYLL